MAWANHHKFECSSLLSQPNTPSACLATQRILHWYEKGVLSAAEMGALIALETQFAARKATEIGNSKDDGGEDNPDCFDLATEAQRQVRTSLAFQPIWGLQCMVSLALTAVRPLEVCVLLTLGHVLRSLRCRSSQIFLAYVLQRKS